LLFSPFLTVPHRFLTGSFFFDDFPGDASCLKKKSKFNR